MTATLGPYELNSIITGDARELAKAIPDESVDLIFTDPVYDRIDDYRWLAETAARVLKPTGALLCWSNGKWHYQNAKWLESSGMFYRYDFSCVHHAGGSPMNGKIISKTNRVLWFDVNENSLLLDYLADGFLSMPWGGIPEHKWTKSPKYTARCIKAFSDDGAIILDPFTGGGTVPAVCKMLGRNYLAFEIDPPTAERARERVRNTQPPLFVVQPEQAVMELATP